MADWRPIHIGFDNDDLRLGDLEVWKAKWRPVDTPPVTLPHPDYPGQMHAYQVFEIGDLERPVRFAAAELSNSVWGFYLPPRLN